MTTSLSRRLRWNITRTNRATSLLLAGGKRSSKPHQKTTRDFRGALEVQTQRCPAGLYRKYRTFQRKWATLRTLSGNFDRFFRF